MWIMIGGMLVQAIGGAMIYGSVQARGDALSIVLVIGGISAILGGFRIVLGGLKSFMLDEIKADLAELKKK